MPAITDPSDREADPEGETNLGDIVVLGRHGRFFTEIPGHMIGVTDPTYNPDNPPNYTEKDLAIQAIIDSLNDDGNLSADDIDLINDNKIQLNEIFPDGIYQMEFNVVGIGEHR